MLRDGGVDVAAAAAAAAAAADKILLVVVSSVGPRDHEASIRRERW